MHFTIVGRIRKADLASSHLGSGLLEDMHEQFLLDQLCQLSGDIQLRPPHSTGNTAHPTTEIHMDQELKGACIETHGVGNSWGHLEQRTHTLGQKLV